MWNKEVAVRFLNQRARARSQGRCAEYVRRAIEAGGLQLIRKTSAKDYGASLRKAGFAVVDGAAPEAGDVGIVQPIAGHPHGHMAMYNGRAWVSDFRQLYGLYPGHKYRTSKPGFVIYRFGPQPAVNPALIAASGQPQVP